MTEIYWITRLDYVQGFLYFLFFGSVLTAMFGSILYITEHLKGLLKVIKVSCVVTLVTGFACIFIPSTKDMLAIYGVGGVVDYVKESDKAKELPDKCIQAVDKFLNDYIEEK